MSENRCEQTALEATKTTKEEVIDRVYASALEYKESPECAFGYFDVYRVSNAREAFWLRYLCSLYCPDFVFDVAARKTFWGRIEAYIVIATLREMPKVVFKPAEMTEPSDRMIELHVKAAKHTIEELVRKVNDKLQEVDLSEESYQLFPNLPSGQANAIKWLIYYVMKNDGIYASVVPTEGKSQLANIWASSETKRYDVRISIRHIRDDFCSFKFK